MKRALALLFVFAAPLAARELDVEALYEQWKSEEARTMERWRVLGDESLVAALTPLGVEWDEDGEIYDGGTSHANAVLSVCYLYGVGGAPLDVRLAERYLSKRALLPEDTRDYLLRLPAFKLRVVDGRVRFVAPGHIPAFVRTDASSFPPDSLVCGLTLLQVNGADHIKAERLVTNAADKGCLPAMVLYARRLCGTAPDPAMLEVAQTWLTKAAESAYAPAWMDLATIYDIYQGAEPDLRRCREALSKAAELGETLAAATLRTLPEHPLAEMTVNELFEQFEAEWGEFIVRKSDSGNRLLITGPSPVLSRHPGIEEWLRQVLALEAVTEAELSRQGKAKCMLAAWLRHADTDASKEIFELLSSAKEGGWSSAKLLYAEHLALAGGLDGETGLAEAFRGEFAPAIRMQAAMSLQWDTLDLDRQFWRKQSKGLQLEVEEALERLGDLATRGDRAACRMLVDRYARGDADALRGWAIVGSALDEPRSLLTLANLYRLGLLPAPSADSAEATYLRCLRNTTDSDLRKDALTELEMLDCARRVPPAQALIAKLEDSLTRTGDYVGFLADNPGIAGLASRAARADPKTGALHGLCLVAGHGITQDLVLARRVLLAASDNPVASYLYARLSESEVDPTGRALRCAVWTYQSVAESEGAFAAYRLALIHSDEGRGHFSRDKAFGYFLQAAAAGCVPAMVGLARCYKEGLGVAVDEPEAKKWAKKAADEGDADAKALLEEWK